MSNRSIRLAILCSTLIAGDAYGQGSLPDQAQIERAAANFLRSVIAERPLAFDGSSVFFGAHRPHPKRDSTQARALAQLLDATELSWDKALSCTDPHDIRTCKLVNAKAIVRLGVPEVTGDSATIRFFSRKMTDSARQPIRAYDGTIVLVRKNGSWQALRISDGRFS